MLEIGTHPAHQVLAHEVARRRTFAIISHPDAGKTTLTEKLLLYGGAVELAGAVRARSSQRHVTSDWMDIERERGISITATALQFEFEGCRLNLLDTPGHQDFSEDTYRTLMAVDSAVMVLDAAKGIEPQTRKLFEVCRLRRIPILTFINKMDHEGRDPLSLLDEIERTLGIGAAPLNWPIGGGSTFQGVYDLVGGKVLRFERTARGQSKAPMHVAGLYDPALAAIVGGDACARLREEVALIGEAGIPFDRHAFLDGSLTPVFFGSALTNFGVEPFLRALVTLAPPPGARLSNRGPVLPTGTAFAAFVFKVQANMDPRHRDRMAFLRICAGRFEKGMAVQHARLGRQVNLTRPYRLFGRDRETIEEAYPGDVVGVVNPGLFAIGDTLSTGESLVFDAIPRFQPEHFALLRRPQTSRYKQFNTGVEQLAEEGVVGLLRTTDAGRGDPILAAVGELQFDVVVARLRDEYGVETGVDRLPYTHARWIEGDSGALASLRLPTLRALLTADRDGSPVVLFTSLWDVEYCTNENPRVRFRTIA